MYPVRTPPCLRTFPLTHVSGLNRTISDRLRQTSLFLIPSLTLHHPLKISAQPRVSRPRPHATGCEGGDGKRRGGPSAARWRGVGEGTSARRTSKTAPQRAPQLALEVALQLALSWSHIGSELGSGFGSRISCSTVVGAIDCGSHFRPPFPQSPPVTGPEKAMGAHQRACPLSTARAEITIEIERAPTAFPMGRRAVNKQGATMDRASRSDRPSTGGWRAEVGGAAVAPGRSGRERPRSRASRAAQPRSSGGARRNVSR
jgi:hypothetical protein